MTRTLSLLGAALPKQLMPAAANNPSGFWEPQAIADLNDEILQAQDSEWDDVFAFRERQYLSNFDRVYLGRAVELLDQQFNGSDVIVLKDPRISVLTSFWDRALKDAGYSIHYVLMVRNPLEVAESLRARDGFPREKSLLLWSSYMVAVERDTRDCNRIFVSYDQLINDWRSVRRRIEASAELPFPRDTAAAANEIDRYLDRSLRHHEAEGQDLFSRSDVPDDVKALFRIFSDACEGAVVDRGVLEAIHAELAKMDQLVGPLLADFRGRVRGLARNLGGLAEAHTNLEEAHGSLCQRYESLELELAKERDLRQQESAEHNERETEIANRLGVAEAERERLAQEIEENVSRTEREIAELAERLIAAEAERDSLEALLQRTRADQSAAESALELEAKAAAEARAALELEAKAAAEARAALELEAKAAAEARAALERREAQLDGELVQARAGKAAAKAQLNEHVSKIATLMGKVEQKEDAIAELRHLLSTKEAELDTVVEQSRAERSAADARLNERFRELAALTSLLADKETLEQQAREHLRWLQETGSILVNGSPTLKSRLLALLPGILQAKRQRKLLKKKGLFDGEAYLAANVDVAADGVDPLRHYLKHGMNENRRRT